MATLKDLLTTIISKLNSKVTTVNGASPDDSGNVEVQEGVQSDWNQNDETAIDYVKNRPFYKELSDVTFIPEQTPGLLGNQDGMHLYYIETVQHIPNEGDECTITLGGQHYTCIVTSVDGMLVLGNTSIIGIGTDTGEPFVINVGDKILASLSPIDELISCTAKSFVYNSVPMEYLDNAAKTVHIYSDIITLERAEKIINSNYDFIIWKGRIFTSINMSSYGSNGSLHKCISLYDTCNNNYRIDYENDTIDINTIYFNEARYPSNASNLRSTLDIDKNSGYVYVSALRFNTGNATEDIMFKVENNGTKNRKQFRVLGNGTVEAYSIILPSITADSTKQFRITVDDSGKPTFTDTSDSTNTWAPIDELPTVNSEDSGKFLRVSSTGEWAAESISNAEEASF